MHNSQHHFLRAKRELSDAYTWIAITALDFLLTSAKNCKKYTIFDSLRTITQEGDMKTRPIIPLFSFVFLSPNCLGTSFLHLKIVKIHFHGVTLLSILVCKIPEFSRWKLWEKDFLPFDSGNIDIEKNEKPGFTFSIALRINSKMFRVISWSKVAV